MSAHDEILAEFTVKYGRNGNLRRINEDAAFAEIARLREREADARRYAFLRENRLGLRAVDGNAGLWEQPKVRNNLDFYVDSVIDNPEYVDDTIGTTDAQ